MTLEILPDGDLRADLGTSTSGQHIGVVASPEAVSALEHVADGAELYKEGLAAALNGEPVLVKKARDGTITTTIMK